MLSKFRITLARAPNPSLVGHPHEFQHDSATKPSVRRRFFSTGDFKGPLACRRPQSTWPKPLTRGAGHPWVSWLTKIINLNWLVSTGFARIHRPVFRLEILLILAALLPTLILSFARTADAATDDKPAVPVTLAQLNNEIQTLRTSLSRTIAALEELKVAANKNRDLSIAFNTFHQSWSELEAQTQTVRQHGTAARARVREHWEVWHAEITGMQNSELREKAQKRYAVTSKEFEKINDKIGDAKEAFAPLAADLKDIHTYLQNDLTRDAVSSLSGNIWKMGAQARTVDGKLAELSKKIERVVKKMSQA